MSLMLSLQLQQRRLRVRPCRLYLYSKYVTSFKYNPMNKARDWTAPLSVAIFFSLPFFVPLCPCHTHTQHGGLFRQQLTPHASVYDSSRAAAQNHLFVSMKNASFLTFFFPPEAENESVGISNCDRFKSCRMIYVFPTRALWQQLSPDVGLLLRQGDKWN